MWGADEQVERSWPPGSLALLVNALALGLSIALEVLMWVAAGAFLAFDFQNNSNSLGSAEVATMVAMGLLCMVGPMVVSLVVIVANALAAR
ncbi:MAG: hypothetical protein HN348_22240, partial [Proteobacteria bacterium]|nr:hypothetical protein [Pseudomonadota bacterium]